MKRNQVPLWTIDQLGSKAAEALAFDYDGPPNDRVRDVPDRRTIRYYTTLGLIDRPAAMRGRTALYGKRHLAQVVAIKRMQAAGRTLAEIAELLPSFGDSALVHVSGVAVPRRSPPPAARPDFWKHPAPPAPVKPDPRPRARVHKLPRRTVARFAANAVLELAPGVTISIDPGRAVTDADADALIAAARPLVAELRRRQLIQEEQEPR